MPGIFGGCGCRSEQYQALKKHFESIYGRCESMALPDGYLGGHAFSASHALHVNQEGLFFVVDGEHSLYENAHRFAQKGEPILFKVQDDRVEPGEYGKGNVAFFNPRTKTLYLATEWTGSFPLFYTRLDNGFLFSSHLRPLAKLIRATADPMGIIQFMKYGFMLAGRTFYKEIRRIMPGQALTYHVDNNQFTIYENSRAFRDNENEINSKDLVEYCWVNLNQAVQRCLQYSRQNALLASSGWDTRVLLAVFRALRELSHVFCYTHGDLKSREINLAQKIFDTLHIRYHLEPLDGKMFNLPDLIEGFNRTENITFPHYHWSGKYLAEMGYDCVMAGVLGEVIGGRHGLHWPMLPISEWEKINFVTPYILRFGWNGSVKDKKDISIIYDLLHLNHLQKPWYVNPEFWNSIPDVKNENYGDMDEFIHRLRKRGVNRIEKIAEAFTAEYFGSQYLLPQLLSCRSHVDVAIPFADQKFFEMTSRIPLSQKILHTLQQAILRRYDSELLRYPNAAAFFNSSFPIPVLEISRLMRKLYESLSWKFSRISGGKYKPRPTGWSTFACLRESKALLDIADDLQCDIVNKQEIKNRIKNGLSQNKLDKSMYTWNAAQNQLMKIYTTDLMLR